MRNRKLIKRRIGNCLFLFIIVIFIFLTPCCNLDNKTGEMGIEAQIDSIILCSSKNKISHFEFQNEIVFQHLIFVSLLNNNYIGDRACFRFIQKNTINQDIDTIYGYLECSLCSDLEYEVQEGEIADLYLCYKKVEEQYFYIELVLLEDNFISAKFYIHNNIIGEVDAKYPTNILLLKE